MAADPDAPSPAAQDGGFDAGDLRPDAGSIDMDAAGSPMDAATAIDARGPDAFGAIVDAASDGASPSVDASGCAWELVLDSPGPVHEVTLESPQHVISFLRAGEGFECARVSVTMQTADNLAEVDAAFDGCPIFSHVLGLEGTGPEGRNLGNAYFRLLRLDCTARRPGAVQLDAWGDPMGRSETDTSPSWSAGARYRFELEVTPVSSTVTLSDPVTGLVRGAPVVVDLTGTTPDMTRDPRVVLGLSRVYDGAYFPYYGASYSDLRVEVSGVHR